MEISEAEYRYFKNLELQDMYFKPAYEKDIQDYKARIAELQKENEALLEYKRKYIQYVRGLS